MPRLLAFLPLVVCLWAQTPPEGMVLVPAGEFLMGRTKLTPDDKTKMRPIVLLDDRPDHKVWLDAFFIDKTEVTQGQYAKFLAATGRKPPYHWSRRPADDYPIYNVDWEDARAYCAWAGKRLPSEAEWERAARGGQEGRDYPWGDKADSKMARYNVETGPGAVAQYPPNGFGISDMAGSVSEWTADWFEREYYRSSPAKNPAGPEAGEYKAIRGGGWPDSAERITVFFRNWVRPNQKTPNLGFRCVKDGR
ncbi:MAG: formylglycine-generating enzyme family protein [Acidobacteria bacterium]|nr:formylglycine-generating enzyme family protein [Acidobacteriota bacterium]